LSVEITVLIELEVCVTGAFFDETLLFVWVEEITRRWRRGTWRWVWFWIRIECGFNLISSVKVSTGALAGWIII
jgi:hypothetical protein